MRVLLTRPSADAARTRAMLEERGHGVVASPVIAIEALPVTWPSGVVDAVLATSGHAFRSIPVGIGPTRETRRLIPLWLVGRRTEEAAQGAGFLGATTISANAVALAMRIKKQGIGRAVYLAGRDRKPDVETALSVTGHPAEVVEVYDAVAATALDEAALQALRAGVLDAALHYSRRSAELFLQLARGEKIEGMEHVCLSDDVAEPLRVAGLTVHVAEEPTEPSLLARLDL